MLTTGRSWTSVAGLQRLLVSSLSKIIGSAVHDHGTLYSVSFSPWPRSKSTTYANDALRADQLDQLICDRALAIPLAVGLEVSKITNMAVLVGGRSVGLAEGVDWNAGQPCPSSEGRRRLTMGASRGAAVGVVTKLVDVDATLGVGIVAGDVPCDGGGGGFGGLLKGDRAGNLGVTADEGNYGGETSSAGWISRGCPSGCLFASLGGNMLSPAIGRGSSGWRGIDGRTEQWYVCGTAYLL